MIKILFVDHALENPLSVRGLWAMAPVSDFKVDRVVSYREILTGFSSEEYDLCLIDSAAGNGMQLLAQARSVGCRAPIVLVAGNTDEVIEALRAGVSDCLVRNDLSAARIERSICYLVANARSASLQIQRERRYLALIDNANEIIYTHDLKGNFTSMNSTGEQTLGYSQSEIRKLNVLQVVVPSYRKHVQSMIEQNLDAQTQKTGRIQLLTKEGRTLTADVGTHPIYLEGKVIEIQGVVRSLFGSARPGAFTPPRAGQPIYSRNVVNSLNLQPAPRIEY